MSKNKLYSLENLHHPMKQLQEQICIYYFLLNLNYFFTSNWSPKAINLIIMQILFTISGIHMNAKNTFFRVNLENVSFDPFGHRLT